VREDGDSEWADMVPPDTEGEDPYNAQAVQIYRERLAAVESAVESAGADGAQAATARRIAEGWTPPERPGPPARPLDLTTVDFPVLAIVGEYDGFYSRTHRMWRELRDFRSIKLPQRGHLSSYYPGVIHEAYLEGIVTFINSHDDPTATVGG
jgi:pimeloyl-ACP methyl ester carboxylesterase